MHSARCARMMSDTVLPLMIESSKFMELGARSRESGLLKASCPCGIENRVEVRRATVRTKEQHGGKPRPLHSYRIALHRGVRGAARAAGKDAVLKEQLAARGGRFALGDQDDVVDLGLGYQRRGNARADAGDVTLSGRVANDDRALGNAGDYA